jgi:hypothetical protein
MDLEDYDDEEEANIDSILSKESSAPIVEGTKKLNPS